MAGWFIKLLSLLCHGASQALYPSGKESSCNTGDSGLIPGSGRSPGEGNGNPTWILAWEIPGTEEPGGLQSMGSQRVRHNFQLNNNKQQHQTPFCQGRLRRLKANLKNPPLFQEVLGFWSLRWLMDFRFPDPQELDYEESWALKNQCFWTVVLEKTLKSPLDCKEIKPVNPKGNQSWIFIGRTDAEAPILCSPDAKNWLIGKAPDAGKDWRQEEKGTTEDEMVGWHHWLDRHEFE